jgi:hypothetical protein
MTLAHTGDVSDKAIQVLEELAREHDRPAIEFAGVFYSESGFSARAYNATSPTASGCFQVIPSTLKGLGFRGTPKEFRELDVADQLEYAKLYYKPHKGKLKSRVHIYVANFLPALISMADDPQAVLSAQGGFMGWVYGANRLIDRNNDGKIQVWELDACITRACRGPRWEELKARIDGEPIPSVVPMQIRSIFDLQRALDFFKFGPGTIDGIPGPKTTRALMLWQRDRGLVPDGIFGPRSKKQMERELGGLE